VTRTLGPGTPGRGQDPGAWDTRAGSGPRGLGHQGGVRTLGPGTPGLDQGRRCMWDQGQDGLQRRRQPTALPLPRRSPQGSPHPCRCPAAPLITPHEAFLAFSGAALDYSTYRLDYSDLLAPSASEAGPAAAAADAAGDAGGSGRGRPTADGAKDSESPGASGQLALTAEAQLAGRLAAGLQVGGTPQGVGSTARPHPRQPWCGGMGAAARHSEQSRHAEYLAARWAAPPP
jgi:hypothetical protein